MASSEINIEVLQEIGLEDEASGKIDPILTVVEGPVAFVSAVIFDLPPYVAELMSRVVRHSLLHQ